MRRKVRHFRRRSRLLKVQRDLAVAVMSLSDASIFFGFVGRPDFANTADELASAAYQLLQLVNKDVGL